MADSSHSPSRFEGHTPGPWRVEQTKRTNWIGPMRANGDGKVAAVVTFLDRDGLKPEVLARKDADAALLAAAPDLLAENAKLWDVLAGVMVHGLNSRAAMIARDLLREKGGE